MTSHSALPSTVLCLLSSQTVPCCIMGYNAIPHVSVVSSLIPGGVCERFKITNSNKIRCMVKFLVLPATGSGDVVTPPPAENAKGKKGKAAAGLTGGGAGDKTPGEVRLVSAFFLYQAEHAWTAFTQSDTSRLWKGPNVPNAILKCSLLKPRWEKFAAHDTQSDATA